MDDVIEELIEFCREHDITIQSDSMYHLVEVSRGFNEEDIRDAVREY